MSDHDPFYVTPPPQHSMPWSGWVNHVLVSREKRLRWLEHELREQAKEMERRREILERTRTVPSRWMIFWFRPNMNAAIIVFGLLYLTLSWLITGEFPSVDRIILLLRMTHSGSALL